MHDSLTRCPLPLLQDEIGLKEWALSMRSAHKLSQELLGSMAKKAGKIYGTDREVGPQMNNIGGMHKNHPTNGSSAN